MEIVYFILMAVVGFTIIYYQLSDNKLRRKIRHLETRIKHYAEHNYLRDYGYDSDECEDCHLPGDCPLCGGS